MSTTTAEPVVQLLASYRIDDEDRRLYAVDVPDEPGLAIIDVLASPRAEDGDRDERHVEPAVPTLAEAEAIASDYVNKAKRLGWCPMHGVWW